MSSNNDKNISAATGVDVWSTDGWRAEATIWLDQQLGTAGIGRSGDVEQVRIMPWATVLKAPTNRGDVWLKAAGPLTAFEVAIYGLLYRAAPNHILEPIALDPHRGWMVLPDGGVPLVVERSGKALIDAMAEVLSDYGHLQRKLAPHAGELLRLGMSDMRPAIMASRFDEAVEAARPYAEANATPEQREQFAATIARREEFLAWCEQLTKMPGLATIDHNDLHPYNVLIPRDGSSRLRIYDWGDSVIAHPFASMLVVFTFLRHHLEPPSGQEPLWSKASEVDIERLRDAYLEAFSDLAPHVELVETLELGCRVGKVARALTWDRALREFGDAETFKDYVSAPLECLLSLFDESYYGGA
jgi:hypothetical protein